MARSEVVAESLAAAGSASSGGDTALAIDPLTAADVADGLRLSDAAGWNQTADDWTHFVCSGRAVGIRDGSGRLVATAAALPYGPALGWISMVLVAGDWRHRGLASRLVDACVAALGTLGLVPVLDATPDGAEVYRRIGFVAGFGFDRWEHTRRVSAAGDGTPPVPEPAASVLPADRGDLDTLAALDRAATGLDRRALLQAFLSRTGTRAWLSADRSGFAIARAGRLATQIGPLVAGDAGPAQALLDTAIAAADGRRTFLDLPTAHGAIAASLEGRGWTRQRSFVRMALGADAAPVLGAGSVVLAGPEFG